MDTHRYEIGVFGLGVMGRNLLLNMADHGYPVAGYGRDPAKVQALRVEAADLDLRAVGNLSEFLDLLRRPRAVLMLVPAGPHVDAILQALLPYLEPGDLVLDGGNTYFRDTEERAKGLAEKGILYLGVGVSGGEHGARHGPSIMVGGTQEAYERVRPVFESIAAKVHGEPCVALLGPGAAGHYVKMVHNGIEYGLMQLIAETYDLMKRGMGLSGDALSAVYERWNQEELNAYLIEITAHVVRRADKKTGTLLLDMILDEAGQKGTGIWASQDAMALGVAVPTIDVALSMRNLSAVKGEREKGSHLLGGHTERFTGHTELFINQLRHALYAAMIVTYAQGMALLRNAALAHEYHIRLGEVARIWRGGCIIRAALLDEIHAAYRRQTDLVNLLADPHLGQQVARRQADLRAVVHIGTELGIPIPGLMVSLAYFDGYRSAWLPANLIQAQRDYFGAHTYKRVDEKGIFHTEWSRD